VIDEDPPHRPGGGRKEVPAAIKLSILDPLQVGFVNEGGGIESAAGGCPETPQSSLWCPAELPIAHHRRVLRSFHGMEELF
jgi:hypothetical protein